MYLLALPPQCYRKRRCRDPRAKAGGFETSVLEALEWMCASGDPAGTFSCLHGRTADEALLAFSAIQRDPERRWGQSHSYLQVKVCGPSRGRALGTVTQGPFAFRPPKADSFSGTGGGIDAKILWLSQTPSSPLMLTVQHSKINHNLYVQHNLGAVVTPRLFYIHCHTCGYCVKKFK